ncbi:MAG: DUF4253 domain-containing protein, partial [Nitrospirota bacterium]
QTATSAASNETSTVSSKITSSVIGSATNVKSKGTGSLGGMKSAVTSTITPSMGYRKAGHPLTLSAHTEELIKTIKFDRHVALIVKEIAREPIKRLIGYDGDGYQIVAPGIAVQVPKEETDHILSSLRKKLLPLHYMPFIVEMNPNLKTDKIGILKGRDPYDILRIMHTEGQDYDISNGDIISRMKEWEKIASFYIRGADVDWVAIEFRTLPRNLMSFVDEVADFSPDTIDQMGTKEKLIKTIQKTNRLLLLWD